MNAERRSRFLRRRNPEVATPVLAPEITKLPDSDITLAARPPISVRDITAGVLPDSRVRHAKEAFVDNFKAPFTVLTATRDGSDEKEYIVVGSSLTAYDTNAMLHHAAPSKAFGLNTYEFIERDGRLEAADVSRLDREKFEEERAKVHRQIERNFRRASYEAQDSSDLLVPVLRFRRDGEGMQIILDPPDAGMQSAINAALPEQVTEPDNISSAMGLMYLAAYSPDNTVWPVESGPYDQHTGLRTTINAAQVLEFAYQEVKKVQQGQTVFPDADLQQSSLLTAIAEYADTGVLKPVKIVGTTEKKLLGADRNKQRRRTALRRTGEVLVVAGALSTIYGTLQGGSDAADREGLDAKYALMEPTQQTFDQATGAHTVLVNLRQSNPEIAPLVDATIQEKEAIIRNHEDKLAQKEEEREVIQAKVYTDVGLMLGGLIVGSGGLLFRNRFRD